MSRDKIDVNEYIDSHGSGAIGDSHLVAALEDINFDIAQMDIDSVSPDELENEILGVLKRGVTEIKAIGGFSGGDKTLLMCVVRTNELASLKKIIQKSDSRAFYFITNVSDIYGNGFYK